MDTRYLESLIAVVEAGSIARAAGQQNLTAAALGQRIQALEKQLGVQLLERSGHRAKATDSCLQLLPRARRIVQQSRQLANDIDPEGLAGSFRLGAISTALTGLLPPVIRVLAERAPQLSLQLKPGVSKTLYAELLDGQLDAALIIAPPQPLASGLSAISVRREPLVLLAHQHTRLSIPEQLKQQPYIRYDAQSWGGRKAEQYLKDQALQLRPFCELDGLEAIEKLVQQQLGVALVPAWAGLDWQASVVTPLSDVGYQREVMLLFPSQFKRPKLFQILSQTLLQAPSEG